MRFFFFALFLTIFAAFTSAAKLKGDDTIIKSESKAVGITTAYKGGIAASAVTSGSSASQLKTNVERSKNTKIYQTNAPLNNILAA